MQFKLTPGFQNNSTNTTVDAAVSVSPTTTSNHKKTKELQCTYFLLQHRTTTTTNTIERATKNLSDIFPSTSTQFVKKEFYCSAWNTGVIQSVERCCSHTCISCGYRQHRHQALLVMLELITQTLSDLGCRLAIYPDVLVTLYPPTHRITQLMTCIYIYIHI